MDDPRGMVPGNLDRSRVLATWRRLHKEEEGIALVLALLIMLVLTIMLTAVIYMTAATARDAHRSNAGQKASALAESGINNALAILNAAYPDTTHPFPGDRCLLHPQPVPAGFPGTAVFGTDDRPFCGNPAIYSSTPDPSHPGETVTYSGRLRRVPGLDIAWVISATGSVPNPTGPGVAPVTRTIMTKVPVVVAPTQNLPPGVLNWLYSVKDASLGQSVDVQSPMYVRGNLTLTSTAMVHAPLYVTCRLPSEPLPTAAAPCDSTAGNISMNESSRIFKPATVSVGGILTQNTQNKNANNDNTVGLPTPTDLLTEAHLVNGCISDINKSAWHKPCGWDTDRVYVDPSDPSKRDAVMPPDPVQSPPVINWDQWYTFGSPGPTLPCDTSTGTPPIFDNDTTQNSSLTSVVNLTPAASYTCHTLSGDLSWDSNTNTLTVKGIIYIDGSFQIDNPSGGQAVYKYQGQGLIYGSGSFTLKKTKMCAVLNATKTGCDFSPNAWDPNKTVLGIVADGTTPGSVQAVQNIANSVEVTSASFQGILSGTKNLEVTTTSTVQGPIISTNGSVSLNQSTGASFPDIHFAPSGGPGNPPPPTILLAPREYGGG